MAPTKSLVHLAALLVVVATAGPVPRARVLGASTNNSVVISGVVPCPTAAGNSFINLASSLIPFADAGLRLVCNGNNVIATTTADASGNFLITMADASKDTLSHILTNMCNMEVTSPLSNCGASLAGATGTLTSPLKLQSIISGTTGEPLALVSGLINLIIGLITGLIGGAVVNVVPMAFTLV